MQKVTLFLLLCFTVSFNVWAEPKELFWEDLVPEGFEIPEAPLVQHDGQSMAQQSLAAPVVESLNGKQVKIPGFVVPLEGEDDKLTEFLLVPYFGACIHVPPPPPNQIVHVTFKQPVPVDNLYDAVWIVGKLTTKSWEGDLATVGYSLQGVEVLPFEG